MTDERPETTTIAIYGGSFNPPHIGHVMIVGYVLATTKVDEVWLVPCFTHAFAKPLAPFELRMQMCELAIADFSPQRVAVSDVEARIGGVSRTIDTVRTLSELHPKARFDLVVGADIFRERQSWKQFDELERRCRFIVIGRSGYPNPEGYPVAPALVDVSSSEVRDTIERGEEPTNLVPRTVADFVREQGLYR